MPSSQAASIINRLRNLGSPELELIADVLLDLESVPHQEIAGTLRIEQPDRDIADANTYPANYPNLIHEDMPGSTIVNRTNFMRPGQVAAQGGFTLQFQGPVAYTPNRDGDVTIFSPQGTIVGKRVIIDGVEVVIVPPPPEDGDCTLKSLNGALHWECLEDITVACCPNGLRTTLTLAWTGASSSGGSEGGDSVPIVWDAGDSCWYGTVTVGGIDADIRILCDGTDWKIKTWADVPSSIDDPEESVATMTEESCDPLLLAHSSIALGTGWSISGITVSE